MRVRYAAEAEADLDEIWRYLARNASERSADGVIDGLRAACERLEAFPTSGSPRNDLAPGLRAVFHGDYAALYVVRSNVVLVLRVSHGVRDLSALDGLT